MTGHSPMGASVSKQFIACPGSVKLRQRFRDKDDSSIYADEGSAAHAVIERCLLQGLEAWEVAGEPIEFGKFKGTIDTTMADSVQMFLDQVRPETPKAMRETHISDPSFHQNFYGTVDHADMPTDRLLIVTDFKYGAGIAVDVIDNTQLLYYAWGIVRHFKLDVAKLSVKMRIVQPRAFHPDGPVREWTIVGPALARWANEILHPAMVRAEWDDTLNPGPHCRFCINAHCPALQSMFGAAYQRTGLDAAGLDDATLGKEYQRIEAVKMYISGIQKQVTQRVTNGKTIPGAKLVHASNDRIFKDGALDVLQKHFGSAVFLPPTIKSPAQIEKLGPKAKELVKEWAHKPTGGLMAVPETDRRAGIKMPSASETFKGFVE